MGLVEIAFLHPSLWLLFSPQPPYPTFPDLWESHRAHTSFICLSLAPWMDTQSASVYSPPLNDAAVKALGWVTLDAFMSLQQGQRSHAVSASLISLATPQVTNWLFPPQQQTSFTTATPAHGMPCSPSGSGVLAMLCSAPTSCRWWGCSSVIPCHILTAGCSVGPGPGWLPGRTKCFSLLNCLPRPPTQSAMPFITGDRGDI